jgi:hypothetical protein
MGGTLMHAQTLRAPYAVRSCSRNARRRDCDGEAEPEIRSLRHKSKFDNLEKQVTST